MSGNLTTNTLKITNSSSQWLTLGGNTLTLTAGGLLFTGSAAYGVGGSVGDGPLKSNIASPSDLVVQQLGSGTLTINSVIANGAGGSDFNGGRIGNAHFGRREYIYGGDVFGRWDDKHQCRCESGSGRDGRQLTWMAPRSGPPGPSISTATTPGTAKRPCCTLRRGWHIRCDRRQ